MVTTMRQSSCFLTHHATKMLIQGCYLGMQLSILEVMLKEKISCLDEILLVVSKSPEPEKKLIQEVQTICKPSAVNPATSAAGEWSFSSQCTASEDVVSIQDGWPRSVEWSQAENRQYLYGYTGVCLIYRNENHKRNFGTEGNFEERSNLKEGLFSILAILDSITREDIYVISRNLFPNPPQ